MPHFFQPSGRKLQKPDRSQYPGAPVAPPTAWQVSPMSSIEFSPQQQHDAQWGRGQRPSASPAGHPPSPQPPGNPSRQLSYASDPSLSGSPPPGSYMQVPQHQPSARESDYLYASHSIPGYASDSPTTNPSQPMHSYPYSASRTQEPDYISSTPQPESGGSYTQHIYPTGRGARQHYLPGPVSAVSTSVSGHIYAVGPQQRSRVDQNVPPREQHIELQAYDERACLRHPYS